MFTLFRDAAGPGLAPLGSVVCIGAFDGVHRGHLAVLDRVRERAGLSGTTPVAITFEPIPRAYFARAGDVARLTSAREKIECLRDAGMQRVLMLRFDARLAAMSAEDFIEQVLVRRVGAREIWIGEDFRYGHARRGDVAMLRTAGERVGFGVGVVPPLPIDGERVSSTRIRTLLAEGDFDAAATFLGRRFAIGGHVVRGQQLGRTLGWPTANLRLGSRVSPVQGIFAVNVHMDGAVYPSVASLGVRPTVNGPTVNGKEPLLEAHLFDFDGDLYGKRIEVEFVAKLRDEEKFPDLPSMVRQIDQDAAQARALLGLGIRPTAGAAP